MKHCVFIYCLGMIAQLSAVTASADETGKALPASASKIPKADYQERILAAARANDGKAIERIVEESFITGANIGENGATQMLDLLLEKREGEAFHRLLTVMQQTNLGKNWQPNNKLLAGLVKDGRKGLIDLLLASRLDWKLLAAQRKSGSPEMAAWIGLRLAEVWEQRSEVDQLIDACKFGDTETVLNWLDAGVDVNCRANDGGWTPLTRAASASHPRIVQLLLDRGAQVDLPKYPGWNYTPLCLTSSVEVANLLKAAGANVHAKLFRRNVSILTYVATFGGAPMVQWLLDQGLDPRMTGDNGQTLLFDVKDEATAEILLKASVDPNRPDSSGNVPLQEARSAGAVRALIRGGAKLTGMKRPLLLGMIQLSQADAVEAVLQAGAPHDAKIMQAALVAAAHMNYGETVEVLLRYGAKPNEPGEWSGPNDQLLPLQVCCIFGSVKAAKVLLAHGADPNGGDKPGLMLNTAASNRYEELAKLLKAAGARGVSDLAYTISINDNARKSTLLASAPAYADQPAFWDGVMSAAARQGDRKTIEVGLQKGAPVYGEPRADSYANAAGEGQWEALELLLNKRPEKAEPEELHQALWEAVWNSHPYEKQRPASDFEKCVSLLLKAGAPVNPPHLTGTERPDYNLVQSAVFTRNPGGNWHVIEMLVTAGADPDPQSGEGIRLSEYITKACEKKGCSTPDSMVVQTLEKLRLAKER